MRKIIFLFFFIFFFICPWNMLNGQVGPDTPDNEGYPEIALYNASQLYSKTLGMSNHLYNGREYNYRYFSVDGTPFLDENNWNTGSVYYDNQLYKGINMKFDIYNNLLIIDFYDDKGFFVNLQLVTDKIDRFSWPGHLFVRIESDTLKNPGLSSGFYDILYEGKIEVLAKYTKSIQKSTQSIAQLETFLEKDFFYILNGGTVFKVTKKRSVIKALANKEGEIKAYIKKHKLKFKDENKRGIQIAGVAAYYDSINEE